MSLVFRGQDRVVFERNLDLPSSGSGSQKVLLQKSKVKFYFSTVRSRVIPILKRIEVGDYPSKIARLYGWSNFRLKSNRLWCGPKQACRESSAGFVVDFFSEHNCSVQSTDEEKRTESERAGLPNLYTVQIGSAQKKIHWTRMIHFASRRMGHPWKGVPVLAVLYSDLTAFRNAREAILRTIRTHAAGFPDITLRGKKSQRQLNN